MPKAQSSSSWMDDEHVSHFVFSFQNVVYHNGVAARHSSYFELGFITLADSFVTFYVYWKRATRSIKDKLANDERSV